MVIKKCCIYAAFGVSQTPIKQKYERSVRHEEEGSCHSCGSDFRRFRSCDLLQEVSLLIVQASPRAVHRGKVYCPFPYEVLRKELANGTYENIAGKDNKETMRDERDCSPMQLSNSVRAVYVRQHGRFSH